LVHKVKKEVIGFSDLLEFVNNQDLAFSLGMDEVANIQFKDEKLNKKEPLLEIESV